MKIVCSSNMPYVKEAFETLGEVTLKDGRAITAADVCDADLLAIRSTTKVSRQLLEGSSVRFVGTATIGTDHFDKEYMDGKGIKWCYAPGCNANSVSEYITSALLCLAERHSFELENMTIGIIGIGNVGSLVARKAEALGMRVLKNDPPRQRAERALEFTELNDLLERADVVTMHVPLTRAGRDATYQMVNEAFFEKMKKGAVFINSARGPVMNTAALLAALEKGTVAHAVIDTWENEPDYSPQLLDRIDLGTPHIAGYSFDGKVAGTLMVYRQACAFLGIEPTWTPEELLPAPPVPVIHCPSDYAAQPADRTLWNIVRQVYNIEDDDRALRALSRDVTNGEHFDGLRKNYPVRREFSFTRVEMPPESLRPRIEGLGFPG